MGALPAVTGPQASREPRESHEEGCPGAWARAGFVRSLEAYERPVADGVYSANPLLDRCANTLVLEAIQYLEQERARARSYHLSRTS